MITEDEFARLVEEGYKTLPARVREKISNAALIIADEPSEEDRKLQGLSDGETLLGLYSGIPLSARGSDYGVGMTLPDTVTIYRLPTIEAAEGNKELVPGIVADTVWHEFAHHFGMDETEVESREQSRKQSDTSQ